MAKITGQNTKKKMPRGKPWKKGETGNPNGRPKISPEMREFRKMTQEDFLNALHKYGDMTVEETERDLARSNLTNFERMFGNLILSAMAGDHKSRQTVLERLWGKVKDESKVEHSTNQPAQVIITLPDNGRSAPES